MCSRSELSLHPRTVVDGLLNNLFIPLEGLVQLVHPDAVLVLVLPVHEGDAVGGLLDDKLLFGFHLELELTVESNPGSGASVLGKGNGNLSTRRKDYWSEGKGVGTDGSKAHHLGLRVCDRSTAGHVVGRASSRSGEHDAISLHDSPEDIVNIDIKSAHKLRTSSSDRDFVKCVTFCRRVLSRSIAVNHHSLLRHDLLRHHVLQCAGQSQSVVDSGFVSTSFRALGEGSRV